MGGVHEQFVCTLSNSNVDNRRSSLDDWFVMLDRDLYWGTAGWEKTMRLKGEAQKFPGMYIFDLIMRRTFGRSVKLESYYGPVQMCVFGLEYEYKPKNYKFKVECERGAIQIEIYNEDGLIFCPWFIYPETRRVHYIDKGGDMEELVQSTYRAIQNEEIIFMNQEEWADMCRKIEFD